MATIPIDIRAARAREADSLADLHAEAWRGAYRGIIPAVTLEQMIARRGGRWWEAVIRRRHGLAVLDFADEIAGYITFGAKRDRRLPSDGEIFELYLKPEFQGLGLGRQLFSEARGRLERRGMTSVAVWALDENRPASRFYRAIGGVPIARSADVLGGKTLDKTAFIWRPRMR